MKTDNANASLLAYFQQQQTPPGWFDLLNVMIDGMVRNVGEAESLPFLRQMGEAMADRTPLPVSETVGELEAHINAQLRVFNWGCIDMIVSENGLAFRHQGIPVARDKALQTRWCSAFCAILEGLYSRWLRGQGGDSGLVFTRESLYSVSDVVFRYAKPQ
ncbi:cellulose biosynthesis protein BcsD [Kosakonia oryzendophytica]|uniref:cellulose biosynthesis protein BcsD n=1 Tax=Kosakonia oryzendophytica TaxID=1005665 RepID=UPI003D33DD8B